MKIKSPAEYVNPYIGTVGHLLTATRPAAMLPHGEAQIYPLVLPEAGDYYFAEKIAAFPIGALSVMFALADTASFDAAASRYDVGAARSHPYSYGVCLEDNGIFVEGTIDRH